MNNNFTIEKLDIEFAREACQSIEDNGVRAKAVAGRTAVILAQKFFQDNEIDVASGLHQVSEIVEDIEIADIYIEESFIDVRLYFENEKLTIPKSHFENNTLPVAYMFIKVDEDLSYADVTGFIRPNEIKKDIEDENYYFINEEDLVSYYDIEGYLDPENNDYNINLEKEIFEFLDKTLSNKKEFYQNLLKSKASREKLILASKANTVFKYVSVVKDATTEEDFNTLEEIENDSFDVNIDPSFDDYESNVSMNSTEEYTNEIVEENPNYEQTIEISDFNVNIENESSANDIETVDNIEINQEATSTAESFEYSTVTTPSLNNDNELSINNEDLRPEDLDQTFDTEVSDDKTATAEQIDELFEPETDELYIDKNSQNKKNKTKSFLPSLLILTVISGIGYWGYQHFINNKQANLSFVNDFTTKNVSQSNTTTEENNTQKQKVNEPIAMPNETVENEYKAPKEETPIIQNVTSGATIDASALASNLTVNWSIPKDYENNSTAKRYFLKIGKIIQLDLKTEFLLLNQVPISNKIEVEIEYNKNSNKFEVKNIISSSGQTSIDETVKHVVTKSLNRNFNVNLNTFSNIPGNPVLVIRL